MLSFMKNGEELELVWRTELEKQGHAQCVHKKCKLNFLSMQGIVSHHKTCRGFIRPSDFVKCFFCDAKFKHFKSVKSHMDRFCMVVYNKRVSEAEDLLEDSSYSPSQITSSSSLNKSRSSSLSEAESSNSVEIRLYEPKSSTFVERRSSTFLETRSSNSVEVRLINPLDPKSSTFESEVVESLGKLRPVEVRLLSSEENKSSRSIDPKSSNPVASRSSISSEDKSSSSVEIRLLSSSKNIASSSFKEKSLSSEEDRSATTIETSFPSSSPSKTSVIISSSSSQVNYSRLSEKRVDSIERILIHWRKELELLGYATCINRECRQNFLNVASIMKHHNQCPGYIRSSDVISCGVCDMRFATSQALAVHRSKSHVISCGVCEERFATSQALSVHRSSHVGVSQKNQSQQRIPTKSGNVLYKVQNGNGEIRYFRTPTSLTTIQQGQLVRFQSKKNTISEEPSGIPYDHQNYSVNNSTPSLVSPNLVDSNENKPGNVAIVETEDEEGRDNPKKKGIDPLQINTENVVKDMEMDDIHMKNEILGKMKIKLENDDIEIDTMKVETESANVDLIDEASECFKQEQELVEVKSELDTSVEGPVDYREFDFF